jgi:RNA polymerase sigma-70 factor (ECF subfamily)
MRDASAAEDVTADTFMKAFQAYERVRPAPDEVQFWLLRIARNTALNAQRRTRIAAIFGRRHHQEQSEDVEHTVEVRQDLRRVLDAAEDLSSRDRELVALRISGLAFSEIGVLMRISADAAGVATRRAMERLRVQYEGLAK